MRVTQALVVVCLAGCAYATSEESPSDRVVYNTISFSDITANHAAMTQLASAKFNINSPVAASMLSTAGSRQVLDYLIGCALPSNASFNVSAGGQTFTFYGDAGLAKNWIHTKLTDKQQRWISACMLARVNNQGQLMKISMRGPHKALRVTKAETERFTQEEGVYYGNIFTGAAPIVGWSCEGQAQANGEGGDGSALSYRDCAEPQSLDNPDGSPFPAGSNQCGWGFSGACFVWSAGMPGSCEKRITTGGNLPADLDEDGDDDECAPHGQKAVNTYYKRCHAGGENPLLQPLWREVITVYVENGPPSLD